jgi:hypothetical protein
MNETAVRQVVISKIADGTLPRDNIGLVAAATYGLVKCVPHARSQAHLLQAHASRLEWIRSSQRVLCHLA